MKLNDKTVLVCDCEKTMTIDGKSLAKACGGDDLNVATHLCRIQLEAFETAARDNENLLIACTQEAPLFLESLEELGEAAPQAHFTNIRERAGWTKDTGGKSKANLTAKMAALLAEAAMDIPDTGSVSMISGGALLILGGGDTALEAAAQVSHRLDVTVLLDTASSAQPPQVMDVPVFRGNVAKASGHLGAFEISVENFAPAQPSSKGTLEFETAGRTGTSVCDLILDLRGGTPLFSAPEKRDGYFNPDPGNPALVMKALLELTDLVGEFEKPRYIDYDPAICAHARSGIVGCSKCLDSCPTGAITPNEDKVSYDPYICAGCGTCASVCPSGAAKYTLPAGDALYERLRTLLGAYLKSGGTDPVILVHDDSYGTEMIDIMARHGGGLPARVLPFAVNSVPQIGLEFLFAADAFGANQVVALMSPARIEEADGLKQEMRLADQVLAGLGYGDGRNQVVDPADPDTLESLLYGLEPLAAVPHNDFLPMGRKRSVMRLALNQLHENAPSPVDTLDLEEGAPFGAVQVNVGGCTLCMSCAGGCPTGALKDNPDKPQLSFAEDACIQCGLCRNTCPEKVITLLPRLSFLDEARSHQVIKEEEPFECVRCGKEFGTKSTIDNMVKKLEGHSMFSDQTALDRLKMCDDCRVVSMSEDESHPLAFGNVPVPRTTDDYLQEREELRQQAAADMKAKGLDVADDES